MQQSLPWILDLKLPDQLHYRSVFICTALVVSGLALSYFLAENSVANVLIVYITDNWKNENLPKAAIVVNFVEGLSAVMTLAIAHVSDAYIGRFTTVALTTFVYLIGILILSLKTTKLWIFYVAAVLIASGRTGQQPPLRAFLADQISMQVRNRSINDDRVEAKTTVWWHFASFLGYVLSLLISLSYDDSSKKKCRILAILMGVAYLIFLSVFWLYYREEPAGSSLTLIYKAFKEAIVKWRVQYPEMATHFSNHELPLSTNITNFRGLEKAAIVDASSHKEDQVKEGKVCTDNQVRKVTELLKMVPMWTTFIVYSLVQTTGSTFFISQTNNLNDKIWNKFTVSIVAILAVKSLSSFLVSYACGLLISKLQLSKANEKNAAVIRIVAGMTCSLICCITARIVEVRRLELVKVNKQDDTISMSILWLTPQFVLLGLMEGLAEDGLDDLLYNHIAPSMNRYGPPLNQFVLGIGSFLSIPCILGFGRWFGDTINESRLDKYYLILVILNVGNLCLTLYFCSLYVGQEDPPGKEIESISETPERRLSAIDKKL